MSERIAPPESFPSSIRRVALRRGLVALLMLCLVVFGLIFPFPFEGRLAGELFDLAHAVVFCLVLLCLIGFCDPPAIGLPSRLPTILKMTPGRIVAATLGLTALGLIGEYLQKFFERNPSWSDVVANSTGLLAALAWTVSRRATGVQRRVLVTVGIALLVAVSIGPLRNAWDCMQQIRDFPMLASFERTRELGSWAGYRASLKRSTEWSSHGDYSVKATLAPDEYPGIAMVWFEHDWRDYQTLNLDLMNPHDTPLAVTIKLFDEYHTLDHQDHKKFQHNDRFQRTVTLEPGATAEVEIDLEKVEAAPESRSMNLKRMWAIEIFANDVKQTRSLFVDHVRLRSPVRI